MGSALPVGGLGSSTLDLTAGVTPQQIDDFPRKACQLLLRCPASNVDTVYVRLGKTGQVTSGDIEVIPGESVTVDITTLLILRVMVKMPLDESHFIQQMTYFSPTATQSLKADIMVL